MIEEGKKYKMHIPALGDIRSIEVLHVYPQKNKSINLDMILYRFWGKVHRKYFYAVHSRMEIELYIEMAEKD